ncbi:hypothetical protein BgiBS90_024840 [Biomphalaria glabrata]|nr:hypothetical protein BgiBS90_024840 [Biomphalaria glabrata]
MFRENSRLTIYSLLSLLIVMLSVILPQDSLAARSRSKSKSNTDTINGLQADEPRGSRCVASCPTTACLPKRHDQVSETYIPSQPPMDTTLVIHCLKVFRLLDL